MPIPDTMFTEGFQDEDCWNGFLKYQIPSADVYIPTQLQGLNAKQNANKTPRRRIFN